MTTITVISSSGRGLLRFSSRTYRWETARWYLSTPTGWLALPPMIRRLMEYRASWVRIPARMAGMPHFVWNRPVARPARRPETKAHSRASQQFMPPRISITATAPPVAMEPSTVRSATSSTRKVMYTPMAMMPHTRPCAAAPGSEFKSEVRNAIFFSPQSAAIGRSRVTGEGTNAPSRRFMLWGITR